MNRRLKKTYRVFAGTKSEIYRNDVIMKWVAYGSRDGKPTMGMGDDLAEALADLALRMLGHEEEAFRFKVVQS